MINFGEKTVLNTEAVRVIGQIISFENNAEGYFNYKGFVWFRHLEESYNEVFYTDFIDTETYDILDHDPIIVMEKNIFAEFEIQPSLNYEIRFVKIVKYFKL